MFLSKKAVTKSIFLRRLKTRGGGWCEAGLDESRTGRAGSAWHQDEAWWKERWLERTRSDLALDAGSASSGGVWVWHEGCVETLLFRACSVLRPATCFQVVQQSKVCRQRR